MSLAGRRSGYRLSFRHEKSTRVLHNMKLNALEIGSSGRGKRMKRGQPEDPIVRSRPGSPQP